MITILSLHIDALVADRDGLLGKVINFTISAVVIKWDGGDEQHYDDAALQERGIVLVEGQ